MGLLDKFGGQWAPLSLCPSPRHGCALLLLHTSCTQELRIIIPWTQLLSQPIQIKLSTLECILTARTRQGFRALAHSVASGPGGAGGPAGAGHPSHGHGHTAGTTPSAPYVVPPPFTYSFPLALHPALCPPVLARF